jgi:hypothetical protein
MRARYGLVVPALLALLSSAPASAQQNAEQVVLDLNHSAMDAYNNMDINRAGSVLEEALGVAQQNGVSRPLLAQTNMNLAVVYVGGLGDNDGGVRYFADALCADPNAQLDPLTSTPDIQSVFQVAVARVQQQGCANAGVNVAPGAAAAGAGPQRQRPQRPPMQEQGPEAPPSMDDELPPGWAATDTSVGKAKDFRRAFFQVGFALGMPWLSPGMPADRKPPDDLVFIHARNGGRIDNPQAFVDRGQEDVLRFPGAKLEGDEVPPDQDYGIVQQNAWEPDRDSYDGYVNPNNGAPEPFTSSSCPGDGKDSGPPVMGVDRPYGLLPTSYCVRVNKPGFAPQVALRANLGYFVTPQVALSLIGRLQFASGQGQFSNMLVGARAEYMFTKRKARGLMISGFLGGTFGQIQARPSAKDATGNEPWVKSGLAGAHIGTTIRYRFTDNFGMFMAPEFDVQFPSFLWNIDLTALGGEVAF